MHGMLSLGVLVAAFAAFAGWTALLSVRLYRACPIGRARPVRQQKVPQQEARPHDDSTA